MVGARRKIERAQRLTLAVVLAGCGVTTRHDARVNVPTIVASLEMLSLNKACGQL
jgi:hypothetical protein